MLDMPLVLYILFTAAISYLNAGAVGRYWTEKEQLPAFSRITLWSGWIMAYIGWLIVVLLVIMVFLLEIGIVESVVTDSIKDDLEPGAVVSQEQVDEEVEEIVSTIMNIAFIGIAIPILGSGMIITFNSFLVFAHRRDLFSGVITGYNTYAQVNNMLNVARHLPSAGKEVGDILGEIIEDKDSAKLALILAPLIISLIVAYFITNTIVRAADAKYVLGEDDPREPIETSHYPIPTPYKKHRTTS